MAEYRTGQLRTVALVGHGASGKTTLAEALLARAGMVGAAGSVERGTTASDFDPLEKTWKHSLRSSILHVDTPEARIHLIDTPGFPDFIGQSIGALDAVETAAIVVNAQAGLEMITTRMMEWTGKRKLCRLVVVNMIDADNVDLPRLLAEIQQAYGRECLPINLPAGGGTRVVDCFFNPSGDADFSSVADAHQALVDQVIEVDEELMAKYLEQGDEISPEQLHAPFEKALREGHLVPVCFVSARTGAGVAELLDVLVKLAPNPTEANPPLFFKGEVGAPEEAREEFRSEPDPDRHVLAHVFKVVVDPFVGKLGVFRVHQGTVTKDTQLLIGDGRKPFKVGHLFMLQGAKNVEIDRAFPGDIAAVAKVDEIEFDCVLHDSHDEDQIHMRPLEFPRPMHGVAITPKKRGDEQRISEVLHKLVAEDPTLVVEQDPHYNETVLRALGDLHLRSVLERMSSQYKLEIDTRPPRIPYRETIGGSAEATYRHKKQTGGAGQFGEVALRIEPLPRGGGFDFVDATKGGVIPHNLMPAVKQGRRAGARARRGGRLPPAGRPRHRVRRQAPPRRLEGDRVRHRGAEGLHRSHLEGEADPPRADRQGRDRLPRGEHRRHHRRPVVAARPGHGHQRPDRRGARGLGPRTAGRARRLRRASQVGDRRPRRVHDGAVALRGRAAAAAAATRRGVRQASQARGGLSRAPRPARALRLPAPP